MSASSHALRALALAAMLTTSACSKHTPSDSSTSESATASENASSEGETPSAPANFDCTKVFSATDTAGVMAPPLKVSAVAMSPGMCELKSPDGSTIQISVDDDRDRALWDDPNQRAIGKYQPVSGLGDEAFAVTSDDGTQLYVKKGSHYCGIIAGIEKVPVKGDALARQVGALCSKVIAAL